MRGLALPALAAVVALPFALYAVGFGWRALVSDLSGETYLIAQGAVAANAGLAVHMLAGGALTLLVPMQLVRRWQGSRAHRIAGRVFIGAGVLASIGGLVFIAQRGTIGGPIMEAGFTLYGILLLGAALQTIRHARAGRVADHRAWALRFFVLAMGSLLFRLHYVLWFMVTGGAGSTPELTGPFDRVQVVAFYLPYLAALEIWLRRGRLRT